ncbi:MAG: ASCH domain-containing protein [Treponema sp.]|nr:ASCH domain-containing protein [Treponema sp.]
MTVQEFWENYLKESGKTKEESVFSGELSFEDTGLTGHEQLALVLSGAKTAMFRPYESFEINMEPLPLSEEVYVVLNSEGEPSCIIELTDVNIIPFCEIPWGLARKDGENENLTEWQDKMREQIQDEADICGFNFREDTKIVCEVFRVIYKPGNL